MSLAKEIILSQEIQILAKVYSESHMVGRRRNEPAGLCRLRKYQVAEAKEERASEHRIKKGRENEPEGRRGGRCCSLDTL